MSSLIFPNQSLKKLFCSLKIESSPHGRELLGTGGTCPPPRFLEANVKSLIFTIIGAPPDL